MALAKHRKADIHREELLCWLRKPLRLAIPLAVLVMLLGLSLTRKPAKIAATAFTKNASVGQLPLRVGLSPDTKMTANMGDTNISRALLAYGELTGRSLLPRTGSLVERMDEFFDGRLSRWHLVKAAAHPDSGITYHRDGRFSAVEVKEHLEALFQANSIVIVPEGKKHFRAVKQEGLAKPNGQAAAAQP